MFWFLEGLRRNGLPFFSFEGFIAFEKRRKRRQNRETISLSRSGRSFRFTQREPLWFPLLTPLNSQIKSYLAFSKISIAFEQDSRKREAQAALREYNPESFCRRKNSNLQTVSTCSLTAFHSHSIRASLLRITKVKKVSFINRLLVKKKEGSEQWFPKAYVEERSSGENWIRIMRYVAVVPMICKRESLI